MLPRDAKILRRKLPLIHTQMHTHGSKTEDLSQTFCFKIDSIITSELG